MARVSVAVAGFVLAAFVNPNGEDDGSSNVVVVAVVGIMVGSSRKHGVSSTQRTKKRTKEARKMWNTLFFRFTLCGWAVHAVGRGNETSNLVWTDPIRPTKFIQQSLITRESKRYPA